MWRRQEHMLQALLDFESDVRENRSGHDAFSAARQLGRDYGAVRVTLMIICGFGSGKKVENCLVEKYRAAWTGHEL